MKKNAELYCSYCGSRNCFYNPKCISCDRPMPGPEHRLMNKTTELWNEFVKLEPVHPDDKDEFRSAIHAIQNLIAARACAKLGLLGMGVIPNKALTVIPDPQPRSV